MTATPINSRPAAPAIHRGSPGFSMTPRRKCADPEEQSSGAGWRRSWPANWRAATAESKNGPGVALGKHHEIEVHHSHRRCRHQSQVHPAAVAAPQLLSHGRPTYVRPPARAPQQRAGWRAPPPVNTKPLAQVRLDRYSAKERSAKAPAMFVANRP